VFREFPGYHIDCPVLNIEQPRIWIKVVAFDIQFIDPLRRFNKRLPPSDAFAEHSVPFNVHPFPVVVGLDDFILDIANRFRSFFVYQCTAVVRFPNPAVPDDPFFPRLVVPNIAAMFFDKPRRIG
jgi:hypothetical protein